MRIVIDMQGAQSTASGNRGVGRYARALVRGIIRHKGKHEVLLVLNAAFGESIDDIRREFSPLLGPDGIHVWQPIGEVAYIASEDAWRRRASELLRETFIASLKPDMVLVTSIFEGLVDCAVTSIGLLSRVPTAVVLYDLIPLIRRNIYLSDQTRAAWYEEKLAHLQKANVQLAISASSRQESLEHLGTAPDMVVNISTAADPQFQPQALDPEAEHALRAQYGLHRPFIMYTGGIDHRKNIEGLIRAYATLPHILRSQHQLAVVCAIQQADQDRLLALARSSGLNIDELVLTGFVPEEDLLALYNLCQVFVFPSWHEGFGLPALEAMACGRATIAANSSSLPEVIGRKDALFDPYSDASIAEKLQQVLTDTQFRQSLQQHALIQAAHFSWDKTAQQALEAMERCYAQHKQPFQPIKNRPKLAYVSPLPPERSGIADYSAELLSALAEHYDIEVILNQDLVSNEWINTHCPQRSIEWFLENSAQYDRVLYHFGNSAYHQHMFDLLQKAPGVVVLHDFFLSGIINHLDCNQIYPGMLENYLYASHGYPAIPDLINSEDTSKVIWKYPCNYPVLQAAQGVIVHSKNSIHLAHKWYSDDIDIDWKVIPHLRESSNTSTDLKAQARSTLDLRNDHYVVCSFGILGKTKLNHRLLQAWLASPLAYDEKCLLIFVGEINLDQYGNDILKMISQSQCQSRIKITGWADESLFLSYLQAADVGVQLRTLSRGETSGTVLDCMNYGLATIVNANGSMADLPQDGVWMLPDDFKNEQLIEALVTLRRDEQRRLALGRRAQEIVHKQHTPKECAALYRNAIEYFHLEFQNSATTLIHKISQLENTPNAEQLYDAAYAIDRTLLPTLMQRQLLVDISTLIKNDSRTGIQRAVRAILMEWLKSPPAGYRVEPIYISQGAYLYARKFTLNFLSHPTSTLTDEPISYCVGDRFIGLDLFLDPLAMQHHLQSMRRAGVNIQMVIYDILPIQFPEFFISGGSKVFQKWLEMATSFDGVICISKSVADTVKEWSRKHPSPKKSLISVDWFHLGANIEVSAPSKGMPTNAQEILERLESRPSLLMVGTLEPRKGHQQVLEAFELLWQERLDMQLVIVGKQGWLVESLVARLRSHPEKDRHLFWLEDISDEYLECLYTAVDALIAASYGEGFGLPLIEAAQHHLPIIARDIPVFREIARDHAFYFDSKNPENLSNELKRWLELYQKNRHPRSNDLPWLTWRQSAKELWQALERNSTSVASD